MALLLLESDVKQLLRMQDCLPALEDAFRSVARGEAVNVPRYRGAMPGVTLNVMPAISKRLDAAGTKIYPILRSDVTVGSSFTFLIYKLSTGALDAILEASHLGQVRTGAATGVATKYMARPDSRVMTLFGAGYQAQTQLEAVAAVLPKLERVNVIGRSPERVRHFCEEMKGLAELVPAQDVRKAVESADVVTTATGAREPLFDGNWLRAGTHVNAIGSNFADKREIDDTAVRRAQRIVADDVEVARIESGDLIAARVDWSRVLPLSDVVDARVPGRASNDEITLFESQGISLEDLAAGCHVVKLARSRGLGLEIPIR
jgi:ornithine cyclodeaminase/alanine dehydrogenase-like protein (mu-crystallin family)